MTQLVLETLRRPYGPSSMFTFCPLVSFSHHRKLQRCGDAVRQRSDYLPDAQGESNTDIQKQKKRSETVTQHPLLACYRVYISLKKT